MILDRILGNVEDATWSANEAAGRFVDWFDLEWHECHKRSLRKTTRGGRMLRILLPPGGVIRHGDVLAIESNHICAAWLVETEVLIVRPRDIAEMGELALAVGNLHAPAQMHGDELWVLPDGPVEAALARLSVCSELARRRFTPSRNEGMPAFGLSTDFSVRST